MTYDAFCYGEIGVDNLIRVDRLPGPEIAVFPSGDSTHIGGAASNSGVWLAHLGLSVGLSGNAIGNDLHGEWLWGWLNEHPGLDLSHVERRADVMTPFTRALITPDGERSFLIFGYPQAPKTTLTAAMLDGAPYVAFDLYGGPERLEAIKMAHAAGAVTLVSDVIWPDHEALPLTGVATNSGAFTRLTFPGVDVRQHARQLQAISKGIVITSDGAKEVFVIDKDGSAFTVEPPTVEAVDATGAGDAFRAGLIAGLSRGLDLNDCVCLGVAAGALKVQRYGAAADLPPAEAVETLAGTLYAQPVE